MVLDARSRAPAWEPEVSQAGSLCHGRESLFGWTSPDLGGKLDFSVEFFYPKISSWFKR